VGVGIGSGVGVGVGTGLQDVLNSNVAVSILHVVIIGTNILTIFFILIIFC
jgi:hypothetical protein